VLETEIDPLAEPGLLTHYRIFGSFVGLGVALTR